MSYARRIVYVVALAPFLAFGQKREIVDLQRDVAQLQDQIRSLQRSLDEKVAALQVLAQQSLDSSNKANTAVAVLQSGLMDKLSDQAKNVVGPVAGVGTKIDQLAEDFRALKESINDMNSRLAKLEARVVDLGTTVRTLSAPPPAPPSAAPAAPSGPPPGVTAEQAYQDARRDFTSGKYDLALQEFTQYLKWFDNTEYAPNAQFYIGEIYRTQKDYDNAITAYDLVLEKYPENNKTPDARLMKGKTLVLMGQRDAGAEEFRTLIKRYPTSEAARKAQAELRALGLRPSTRATKKRRG